MESESDNYIIRIFHMKWTYHTVLQEMYILPRPSIHCIGIATTDSTVRVHNPFTKKIRRQTIDIVVIFSFIGNLKKFQSVWIFPFLKSRIKLSHNLNHIWGQSLYES